MNIAIITACPNGQVSSVLSARLLAAAARQRGWNPVVEVQDVERAEGRLSPAQIAEADWVLVVSTGPVDLERFVGKRVYRSTPAQALADRERFRMRRRPRPKCWRRRRLRCPRRTVRCRGSLLSLPAPPVWPTPSWPPKRCNRQPRTWAIN